MISLLVVGSLTFWSQAFAGMISAAGTRSGLADSIAIQGGRQEGRPPSEEPLGSLLNADGRLDLSSGFSGSLDPSGWQMVSAAGQPPRFVPSSTTSATGKSRLEGQPVRGEPDTAPELPGDENWDGRFGVGLNDSVFALAVVGSDLYLGGYFTQAGGTSANHIARWDPASSTWSALGSGTNGVGVEALAVIGTDLYVGGNFSNAGGIDANDIAKWDTLTNTWSPLGSGIGDTDAAIDALAAMGSSLYVGGYFTHVGGIVANNIARWDPASSTWSALGVGRENGTDNYVMALAASGSDLYVGGPFHDAGYTFGPYIAYWDANTQQWGGLGTNTTDNLVYAFAISGGSVYAGGSFTMIGGVSANHIARWNGSAWSSLGSGTDGVVGGLAINGSELFVGGYFTQAGGVSVNNIAMWNGSTWAALGSGVAPDGSVGALVSNGSNLWVGGAFTSAGGLPTNNIAKWDSSANTWSIPNGGTLGPSYLVYSLAVSGSDVYMGGDFTQAGAMVVNYIARWDGSAWSALGGGTNGDVDAILVNGTDVYATGDFTQAGGVSANYIAKWDTTTQTWSALGSGLNSWGRALAMSGTDLYVGGIFTQAGGVNATCIARWDGTSWSALGTGTGGSYPFVLALTVSGSYLYAGGDFTQAGGVPANYVARWDIDSNAWSALGSGTNGTDGNVFALAVDSTNGDLYAGGIFSHAGGVSASYVARWDGSSWSSLGSGVDGTVQSIALDATKVYIVGHFTTAGVLGVNHVAMWDTNSSTWSALGSGLDDYADALALQGNDANVGGAFLHAGGKSAWHFDIWHSQGPLTPTPTPNRATATPTLAPTQTPGGPTATPTPASCSIAFTDVPAGSTFYPYVQCLACQNILGGYTSGCPSGNPCFKPNNQVTRGQLAKIVSNSAGYSDQHSQQTFQDVVVGSTFYPFIERLATRNIIGGYACGGAGEPCGPGNLPYFRPNAQVTRGQTSKIVAIAASLPAPSSGQQTFQDVPTNSTFRQWIESLASAGTIGGYQCGGAGEPCISPQNRPYFRPSNDVTRGQAAKIVSNTFFPNCHTGD